LSTFTQNCHQRPKFGAHRFCGKTCAAQAAAKPAQSKQSQPQAKAAPRNAGRQKGAPAPQKVVQLCSYCGQKPKFNSFDYCGKSCAALSSAAQTKPPAPAKQGAPAMKQKTTRVPNAPPNNAQAPVPAKSHKGPRTKVPVPQDDSTEEEEEHEDVKGDSDVSTDLDAYPSDSGSESEDKPSVKGTSRGGKPGSGVPRIAPGTCAITGCGQPSHIDRNGIKTMYCSIKHREEAVKLGLEAACIMCQQYPQSTSDYFCSSACRNQSMVKT
ncbi:hypothetical protein J3R83DRAFT_8149, partial [Lanmaoa asiatica]